MVKATEQDRSESCGTPVSESDRTKFRIFVYASAALITTGFAAGIMDIMILEWLLPIGIGGFACALVINIERKTDDPISPGMFAWLWASVAGEICYAWFLL